MEATTTMADLGNPNEIIFEEKPSGWVWIAFLVIAVVTGFLASKAIPPTSGPMWAGAIVLPLITLGCLYVAWHSFGTRNDSRIFFGDRVETYRNGQVLHALAYADVQDVDYGFRSDVDQYLNFKGPGGQPFIPLRIGAAVQNPGPRDLTPEKLVRLRDVLNRVVADRLIAAASTSDPPHWFAGLHITRQGLRKGGELVPWTEVQVDEDESNGTARITHQGRSLGTATMIGENIVPGLIAIDHFKSGSARG